MSSKCNQVDHALKAIFRPGESREEAKQRGEEERYIYSHRTLKRYTSACITLWEAVPPAHCPHELKDMMTPATFALGFAALQAQGNQDATLRVQLSAWRKMGSATEFLGWTPDLDPYQVVPRDLDKTLGRSAAQGPVATEVLLEWLDLVLERIRASRTAARQLELMLITLLAFGLRIDEAATLRQHNIDRRRSCISVDRFAKGGRPRAVLAITDLAKRVLELLPTTDEYMFTPEGRRLGRRLQEIMHDAAVLLEIEGRKGPHRLRANWAQDMLDDLRMCLPENEARQLVCEWLGHGRTDILNRYTM